MAFYRDVYDYGYMVFAMDPDDRTELPEQTFIKTRKELFNKLDELLNTSKTMISISPGTFHRFEVSEEGETK